MKSFFYFLSVFISIVFAFFVCGCEKSDNAVVPEENKKIEPLVKTGLPILYFCMDDSLSKVSKEKYTICSYVLTDSEGNILNRGEANIKGRGNSTWEKPKKPYNIKLDDKASLLGMPANKKWCLLANWYDRTLLRNALAFEIARRIGMEWASHGEWVELVVNGIHEGNYYLCEKIEADVDRVNITKKSSEDDCGFLMEIDNLYDEKNKFMTSIYQMPYMIKYPDDDKLTDGQFRFIQNYVACFEESLNDSVSFSNREYLDYIDEESFVDFWLVYEICCCWEPVGPRSCYVYKDREGKLKAGPVWDFDLQTFKPGHYTGSFPIKKALYYKRLFDDSEFEELAKQRWKINKYNLNDIEYWIDIKAKMLYSSSLLNFTKWPVMSTLNGDKDMEYFEAIETMKIGLREKLEFMNKKLIE